MSIKILIVEDDLIIAENLKENLLEIGYKVVGIASSYEDVYKLYHQDRPDLCIVDIHLRRSAKNGIEIMTVLNAGFEIPIIYLTSYDDQNFRNAAKFTNPSAYLIKPCSKKQIDVAIDFAVANFHKKELNYSIHTSQDHYHNTIGRGYFFIKVGDKYKKIYANEICYLTASGPYCKIATENKEYTISANLKSFLLQLNNNSIIRCHRSYAINIDRIQAFDDISLFILRNTEIHDIPISNTYKSDIFSILPRIKAD